MTLPHQDPLLQKSVLLRSNIYDLTSSFKSWLVSKNYSGSTIRNYLSDINAYFDFSIQNPPAPMDIGASSLKEGGSLKTAPFFKGSSPMNIGVRGFNSKIFSSDTISAYLQTIKKNSAYSRYLSSLSKFFQFAQDQSLISHDPLKAALKDKKPSADEIINQYSQYLNKKRFSESTIKNYLNDIRQYIDFCNSQKSQNSNLQNPNNQ